MPVHESKTEVQKAEEKQTASVEKIDTSHADLLSDAAASGDAAVHDLLGHRVIAVQNQDEDAIKEIDKKLKDRLKK